MSLCANNKQKETAGRDNSFINPFFFLLKINDNDTNDSQNWTTAKRESDLLITSIITDRIRRHEVLLYVFKTRKKQLNTRSVRLHRHDLVTVPLTVLLKSPVTSMARTLT